MTKKMINIRLDEDLWRQARLEALRQGKTMQEWLADAIASRLLREGNTPVEMTGKGRQ